VTVTVTLDPAIQLAPSDVAADALRRGVLAEIKATPAEGDAFLDVLRRGAAEVAVLATLWHEPEESFRMLLEVAIDRGLTVVQARGIVIGAFGCDPTASKPAVTPNLGAPPLMNDARRKLATVEGHERLVTYQQVALEYGSHLRANKISRIDAADELMEMAESSGIMEALRLDDLQHLLSEAFQGRAAIPERLQVVSSRAESGKHARGRRLVVRRAADITPEPISWLWPHRIAVGKLTLLAGQPGLGKSQLTAALAAATTAGERWPCNEGSAPVGSVIVLSAEDDAADTQIPRLLAAGADCRRVYIVSAVKENDATGHRTFNIQADLDLIEQELDRIQDVTLISIDPLSSYLGKVDSHNNTEVRAVLERVSEMAARRRVAVIGVTHFNKGDGSAINKVIGSIAFVAAARSAWMVAMDPGNVERRLFVSIKNNVGHSAPALAFRIAQIPIGENRDIIAPYVVWEAEPVSNTTADQLLAAARGGDDRSARAEAVGLLQSILADGGQAVGAIQNEAVAAGLLREGAPVGKDKAFRCAKKQLGISRDNGTVYRGGGTGANGQWFWRLPAA
jgi:hypothetical protein